MIKDFQKRNYLIPDGIVGKKTAEKIMGVYCNCSTEWAAHFLGQTSHETRGFEVSEENLNYSYERFLEIFSYDADSNKDGAITAEEKEYVKTLIGNPEKIANFVYANQNGNGDEASGDGWKYRGRGAIMLSGRGNYETFANKVGDLSIMENPDLVNEKYYLDTAKVYFDTRNIWKLCDDIELDSIKKVTRKINGGYIGLKDRIKQTEKYYNMLI